MTTASELAIVVDDNIMDQNHVTVAEAARRLGRSIEQVRRYLREGKLPGQRIGQQWFIEEEALAGWLPSRREASASRISEAVTTYEVRPMKTHVTKKRERLISEELFREINETAEKIRREAGEFDVVGLLREEREEH